MATGTLVPIIIFTLLSLSSSSSSFSLPSETMREAAKVLSNSGFVAMALTLEFGSKTLIPANSFPPSLTIFSPSDPAFALSGQPSLSLLHYHFSPASLPLKTLTSLPSGANIPTLFPNHSLVVTTSSSPPFNGQISLNNVAVNVPPIYDNGYLVIFGIDKFLDPSIAVMVAQRTHGGGSGGGGGGGNLGSVASVNFEAMLVLIVSASLFLNL